MFSLLSLFVTPAYAEDNTISAGVLGNLDMGTFLNYLEVTLIVMVIYFLIFRPQQKKMEDQTKLLKTLQKGDKVVTASGIFGKITKIEGDTVVYLAIAEGVEIKVLKTSVAAQAEKPESDKSKSTDDQGKK